VHINVNWITPVKIRELFITGAHGLMQVDYMLQLARFAPGREARMPETYEGLLDDYNSGDFIFLPVEKEEPLRRELRAFVEGIVNGNLPDPRISLESLRIAENATAQIEAAYEERVLA
jgi:predicted dehydrogenase